ncbi:hypothetical protein N752_24210 [Desulforamulus aquiferis]|nr:hypothetical protein N752_24210 [Desulforamulus aquiferis]
MGVGGGAAGLVPQIAARMGCYPILPPYAPVANAIGAAVARPTLQVSLRADTQRQTYVIEEEGYQGKISGSLDEIGAVELAKSWLVKRAEKMNLQDYVRDIEITNKDVFNIVREWQTTGKLYDISVQTPRGILGHIGSGGRLLK